jgi:hypothetical protein
MDATKNTQLVLSPEGINERVEKTAQNNDMYLVQGTFPLHSYAQHRCYGKYLEAVQDHAANGIVHFYNPFGFFGAVVENFQIAHVRVVGVLPPIPATPGEIIVETAIDMGEYSGMGTLNSWKGKTFSNLLRPVPEPADPDFYGTGFEGFEVGDLPDTGSDAGNFERNAPDF